MKTLVEMPNGMGGKWILAKFEDDFYGYGTEDDFRDKSGLPVDQCGTKESVIEYCSLIAELCKNNIEKYQKEVSKEKSDGWKILLDHEKKELEMLIEFSKVLSKIK